MSYRVSVYFHDEHIASTNIRSGSFINITKYFGDDAYIADSFTNSTTFTATPADGCKFVNWYYRIGGDDGELQESTDNPFYYSGTEEIIIRAVGAVDDGGGGNVGGGGDTEGSWSVVEENLGVITSQFSITLTTQAYRIYRFDMQFRNSGTARFGTTGAVDTRGYLSTTTDWRTGTSKNTCRPSEYVAEDDESGALPNNFEISYDVEAGTKYYLWVRGYHYDDIGSIGVYIIPPEESIDGEWNWSNKAYNAFANNGKTEDVSRTEWNNFVNFVAKKTGYSVSAALMDASDRKLYATQFNAVRYAIGSVNTFQNGTNSIKKHYEDTGRWDMSSGEVVKGQYFIDLTTYLNDIQT